MTSIIDLPVALLGFLVTSTVTAWVVSFSNNMAKLLLGSR